MSDPKQQELEARLVALARDAPWFMSALEAVRRLALPSWCIGAGAVRNLVWDALHEVSEPSDLADVDVAHFDLSRLEPADDAALEARLSAMLPGVPWEVTNQASVHLWFEGHFGHAARPLLSLEDAVASWPEFATAVGLALHPGGAISVIAPHGLGDLFDCVVRRNPARASIETYRARTAQKAYARRWPMVTIIES